MVYPDGVHLFAKSVEELLRHVTKFLPMLRSAHVLLKLSKCELFRTTVTYLGHVKKTGKLEIELDGVWLSKWVLLLRNK